MSDSKVSDFEIMAKIASEGSDDGIALFPDLLSVSFAKKGCHITFGATTNAMQWMYENSHYFILYAIKKRRLLPSQR